MSMIPIAASMVVAQQFGFDHPYVGARGWNERYGKAVVSQFRSAQMIAEKWNI